MYCRLPGLAHALCVVQNSSSSSSYETTFGSKSIWIVSAWSPIER
jgi:hypothetical protein